MTPIFTDKYFKKRGSLSEGAFWKCKMWKIKRGHSVTGGLKMGVNVAAQPRHIFREWPPGRKSVGIQPWTSLEIISNVFVINFTENLGSICNGRVSDARSGVAKLNLALPTSSICLLIYTHAPITDRTMALALSCFFFFFFFFSLLFFFLLLVLVDDHIYANLMKPFFCFLISFLSFFCSFFLFFSFFLYWQFF